MLETYFQYNTPMAFSELYMIITFIMSLIEKSIILLLNKRKCCKSVFIKMVHYQIHFLALSLFNPIDGKIKIPLYEVTT